MIGGQKKYLNAVAAGVASRVGFSLCRFLSVPLMLNILDPERYGLWLMITSIVSWLGLADLGMPSALQSPLAGAIGTGDYDRAKQLVGYTWTRLRTSGLIAAITATFAIVVLPTGRIFGVSAAHRFEFTAALITCVTIFGLGLPFRIGSIIAYAFHRADIPPLLDLAAQILSLCALVVISWWHIQSLFAAIVATVAIQLLISMWNLRRLVKNSNLKEFWKSPHTSRDLGKMKSRGTIFLLILIGEGLVLQSDNLLIGHIKGAAAIEAYAIPAIFVMQFLLAQNVFLRPLWVVLAKANAQQDYHAVGKIYLRGIGISLVSGILVCIGLVCFGQRFITFWTHGKIAVSATLMRSIGLYIVALAPCNFMALYCNAIDLVGGRLIGILSFGLAKVGVGWWWLKYQTLSTLPVTYAVVACATDLVILILVSRRHLKAAISASGGAQAVDSGVANFNL